MRSFFRFFIIFVPLIVLILLFFSCTKRTNDYSIYSQGTVLSGKMKNGNTLYLVREDSVMMSGFFFIDSGKAVVEKIAFFADSTGVANFIYGNDMFLGKMSIKKPSSKEMELTLPDISTLNVVKQTVRLKYFGALSAGIDCQERYKNPVFENIIAKKNMQYGIASGYYSSRSIEYVSNDDYKQWFTEAVKTYGSMVILQSMKDLQLFLDIYSPENDNLKNKPLLLFIHGGAFIFGDKEDKTQKALTDYFVKRGYIVASINYRMGSLGTELIDRTIYRNIQDARAALRYLVNNKEKYGIDDEQIYLVGSSAGGIIALTTAFMDSNEIPSSIDDGLFGLRKSLGGLDDSGNDLKNSFKISGVVSLWGAVSNMNIVNNNIPTLLFHGTDDDIVPAGEGLPFKNYLSGFIYDIATSVWQLYGSEPIFNHLSSAGIPAKYVPFPGCGHEVHVNTDGSLNENIDIITNEMGYFLFENVAKHYFDYKLSGKTSVTKYDITPVYQFENAVNVSVQWYADGGLITKQSNEAVSVVWYSGGANKTGTITACVTNENGVSYVKELEIKIK